jgi:predicted cupin superfamily sugar epimerase
MWFAAHIPSATGYSLVSCVVAPGFDFADFELAKKDELLKMYPNLTEEIEMFGM